MPLINISVNEQDKKIMEDYADLKGISISELIMSAVFEKIDDEIDIELYKQAMQEYIGNPEEVISFSEAMKELGYE